MVTPTQVTVLTTLLINRCLLRSNRPALELRLHKIRKGLNPGRIIIQGRYITESLPPSMHESLTDLDLDLFERLKAVRQKTGANGAPRQPSTRASRLPPWIRLACAPSAAKLSRAMVVRARHCRRPTVSAACHAAPVCLQGTSRVKS
jgi:hypothetical protein